MHKDAPSSDSAVLLTGPRLWALLLVIATLVAVGCEKRPKAPALSDAPVYSNRQEGFRFLVPDNWMQSASAALPDTKLQSEVLLVQYRMKTAHQGAMLDVLVFDEDRPADLAAYHTQPSHGVENWSPAEEPQDVTIHEVTGQRFVYEGKLGEQTMIKEVVAFRRGQRVYSFIGLFWDQDLKAREQLRRAVGSLVWTR